MRHYFNKKTKLASMLVLFTLLVIAAGMFGLCNKDNTKELKKEELSSHFRKQYDAWFGLQRKAV